MTMESLPTESLTHILQYLPPIDRLRAEQVCRKWRDASRQTWRDVKTLYIIQPNRLDYYHRFRDCTEFHELVEKEGNRLFIGTNSLQVIRCLVSRVGYFLKKLIFSYMCSGETRAILPILIQYCHNLKILELPLPSRADEVLFSRLFECNKELHSIKCQNTREIIDSLPLRNWRSLRLRVDNRTFEEKILTLIEHSDALEEFETMVWTTRIVEALLNLRNLKSLYFSTCCTGSLEMIFHVPLLNQLRNLMIDDLRMDTQLLCDFLQHCCQLKKLAIERYSISSRLLEVILALPELETLELTCNWMMDDLLMSLTKFRNLLLRDGESVATDNGILQMIRKSEILEKLDIRDTMVTCELFKQLVGEMNNRRKYLEVIVNYDIFNEVSKICAGSKIRVVRDFQCFGDYTL